MIMFSWSLVSPMGNTDVAGSVVRMMGMSCSVYQSFESTVGSRSVLDNTVSTISFFQRVAANNMIPMSVFVLWFEIMSVGVVYAVFKFIVSMALEETKKVQWLQLFIIISLGISSSVMMLAKEKYSKQSQSRLLMTLRIRFDPYLS